MTDDHLGRPRLLIADDDTLLQSVLSTQLSGDFEVVAVASDAAEASDLAAEHKPDAALVDVEMPAGGGIEAVRQIRERSPGTCVVVLSGDESHGVVVKLLEAGAVTYIRKGVPGSEIVRVLRESMKASQRVDGEGA